MDLHHTLRMDSTMAPNSLRLIREQSSTPLTTNSFALRFSARQLVDPNSNHSLNYYLIRLRPL